MAVGTQELQGVNIAPAPRQEATNPVTPAPEKQGGLFGRVKSFLGGNKSAEQTPTIQPPTEAQLAIMNQSFTPKTEAHYADMMNNLKQQTGMSEQTQQPQERAVTQQEIDARVAALSPEAKQRYDQLKIDEQRFTFAVEHPSNSPTKPGSVINNDAAQLERVKAEQKKLLGF